MKDARSGEIRPVDAAHAVDETAVSHYMAQPYRFEIYQDDGHWAAECEDLPGLVAGHETWDGLGLAIEDAKRTYFESALERGFPIPEPSQDCESYSGRLMLRLPKTLHRQAAKRAQREGVSLNSFVASAVAREVGPSRIVGTPEFDVSRAIELSPQDRSSDETDTPRIIVVHGRNRVVFMTSDPKDVSQQQAEIERAISEGAVRTYRDLTLTATTASERPETESRR